MDWKLFLSTFGAVFLAELGDKTQLATVGLAGSSASKWTVFFGAALALVLASGLGVLGGTILSRFVSPLVMHKGAGALFVAIGLFYLLTRPGTEGEAPGPGMTQEATPAP